MKSAEHRGHADAASAWIVSEPRRQAASMRLICLPYAGAGAAIYHDLKDGLPEWIQVIALEPPGKFARSGERLIRGMDEFVAEALNAIGPLLTKPFALFGYSLGAIQAFEMVRRLRREQRPLPRALLVAARPAPHLPKRRPDVCHLDERELLLKVEERYGRLAPLIATDPELRSLVAKIMRADLGMLEDYVCADEPQLEIPIHAYAGSADLMAPPDDLQQWQVHTTVPLQLETFPGGHFFLREQGSALRAAITHALLEVRDAPLATRGAGLRA